MFNLFIKVGMLILLALSL